MPSFSFSTDAGSPDRFVRAGTFLASTVCVLSSRTADGTPVGMTVSAVLTASQDPPLLLACVSPASSAGATMAGAHHVAVSVLRADQAMEARRFGGLARGDTTLPTWDATPLGLPAIPRALAVFECAVDAAIPVGDHVMLLLRVGHARTETGEPLVYWRRGLYSLNAVEPFLESEPTFVRFVRAFRDGDLPAERWSHAAHVATAAYYAHTHGDGTYAVMREAILHFNECCGVANTDSSGYHDTLTRFWSDVVVAFVRAGGFATPFEAARAAAAEFGSDRDLFRMYYGHDVVRDPVARRGWVPPPADTCSIAR